MLSDTVIATIGTAAVGVIGALAAALVHVWRQRNLTNSEVSAKDAATKSETDAKSQDQLNAAFVLFVQQLQATIENNRALHAEESKRDRLAHAEEIKALHAEIRDMREKRDVERHQEMLAHADCLRQNAELRGEVRANALRANQQTVELAKATIRAEQEAKTTP